MVPSHDNLHITGTTAISDAFFGAGSGPVWLAELTCVGNETNLLGCPFPDSVGASNCAHALDASVICQRRESNFLNSVSIH